MTDAIAARDDSDPPMLSMRNITKRFPGVVANDRVSFDVRAGEVHTLLGENGAGKSTLMKILYGLYQPDEGEVLIDGKAITLKSPADAINHHIGMIHQHFMLVPTLTVTENVALGLRSSRTPMTDLKRVAARIRSLSDEYGLHVDPDAYIWQLAVGERQRVEIIKALYRDVRILVLDEPTAVLTPQEVDEFFVILREMARSGRGLVFISHKLHEVMQLSHRITVLRQGRVSGQTTPQQTSPKDLARMMVGRDVETLTSVASATSTAKDNQSVLNISGLHVAGDRGVDAVVDLDLDVFAGEILGVAGVSGNGQRELAEAIAGLRQSRAGEIQMQGKRINGLSPRDVRQAGVAFVPEERMRDGAIGEFSVMENAMLLNHGTAQFSHKGFLKFNAIRQHAKALVDQYQVKTPDIDTPTRNLSGGNIQKLIMARELSSSPRLLVCAQPTRGVDIGAAAYIHERLIQQRDHGTAILVISEDLDEIFALADRIAVLCEGRLMGTVAKTDADRETLGLLMAGVETTAAGHN